jgi:hypothetical protein
MNYFYPSQARPELAWIGKAGLNMHKIKIIKEEGGKICRTKSTT